MDLSEKIYAILIIKITLKGYCRDFGLVLILTRFATSLFAGFYVSGMMNIAQMRIGLFSPVLLYWLPFNQAGCSGDVAQGSEAIKNEPNNPYSFMTKVKPY